jgi:hypothetical protein
MTTPYSQTVLHKKNANSYAAEQGGFSDATR